MSFQPINFGQQSPITNDQSSLTNVLMSPAMQQWIQNIFAPQSAQNNSHPIIDWVKNLFGYGPGTANDLENVKRWTPEQKNKYYGVNLTPEQWAQDANTAYIPGEWELWKALAQPDWDITKKAMDAWSAKNFPDIK